MVGRARHDRLRWAAALLLWAMFALALTSLRDEAPTFDEQGFLVRGLAYLRGEANGGSQAIRVGHPLGLNALNAALLANDPAVRLPSDVLAAGETDFHLSLIHIWKGERSRSPSLSSSRTALPATPKSSTPLTSKARSRASTAARRSPSKRPFRHPSNCCR